MAEQWTKPIIGGESVDISSTDHSCTQNTRGLYVGGTGNVKVDLIGEQNVGTDAVTFTDVAAGTLLPIRCSKVYKTGTTATSMLALW